jgi:hypothetical protein
VDLKIVTLALLRAAAGNWLLAAGYPSNVVSADKVV